MNTDVKPTRELLPFEHLVLTLMCDGLTNRAIASQIHRTEKTIENTISRAAQAFNIKASADRNLRVSLTLAYLMHNQADFGSHFITSIASTQSQSADVHGESVLESSF